MDTHSESATPAKSVRLGRSVALLLSLLGAGSGHVVIGHSKRGLRWLASLVLAVLGLVTLVITGPRLFGWAFAIITVGLRLGAIVDVLRLPIRATGSSRLHTILMVLAMLAASGLTGVATLRLINAVRQPS